MLCNIPNKLGMVKTGRPEAVKPHRTEMAGSLKSLKSMLGGMVGVVVAHACLRGIVRLVPPNLIPDFVNHPVRTPTFQRFAAHLTVELPRGPRVSARRSAPRPPAHRLAGAVAVDGPR